MTDEGLVVEQEILKSAFFDCLQHESVGAVNRRDDLYRGKPAGRLQSFTAAATAVTDKCRILPDIFANLYQVGIIRTLQSIHGFFLGNESGMSAMLRQRAGHISEGETDVPGGVDLAGVTGVFRLVTAVAQPQSDILSFFHDVAGLFIIQDMVHLGAGQYRLLHIDTSQFGLGGVE